VILWRAILLPGRHLSPPDNGYPTCSVGQLSGGFYDWLSQCDAARGSGGTEGMARVILAAGKRRIGVLGWLVYGSNEKVAYLRELAICYILWLTGCSSCEGRVSCFFPGKSCRLSQGSRHGGLKKQQARLLLAHTIKYSPSHQTCIMNNYSHLAKLSGT